jgi:hypothetical protein
LWSNSDFFCGKIFGAKIFTPSNKVAYENSIKMDGHVDCFCLERGPFDTLPKRSFCAIKTGISFLGNPIKIVTSPF